MSGSSVRTLITLSRISGTSFSGLLRVSGCTCFKFLETSVMNMLGGTGRSRLSGRLRLPPTLPDFPGFPLSP
eukprot:2174434-Pyramimonas_sp.AAC.1